MLLNNEWVTEEINKKSKKYLETNENRNNDPKFMDHSKSSSKKEVYSNTVLPQGTNKKPSNKQLTYTKGSIK